MARFTATPILGTFEHAETGAVFDFAARTWHAKWAVDAPYDVAVGDGETRAAKVLKTVAYVAIDEDADGHPIYERWPIRRITHKE